MGRLCSGGFFLFLLLFSFNFLDVLCSEESDEGECEHIGLQLEVSAKLDFTTTITLLNGHIWSLIT